MILSKTQSDVNGKRATNSHSVGTYLNMVCVGCELKYLSPTPALN